VAGVTLLDSDTSPILKIFISYSGLIFLHVWKYDSCSNSGSHQFNRDSAMFAL